MARILWASVFSMILSTLGFGQIASTTSLVGTITDSHGASVAGAKVTAVNRGTRDTYNATTNGQGYYSVEFIRVGVYDLTVEQPGFQKITKAGIVVEINQAVRSDIELTVGALSQSVTIEAVASSIKTDDATVSEIISTRHVADLPLNGRDPLKLAAVTAGTISGLKASNGTPPGEDFIGAGTREIQNSIALDGISIVNNLITTTPTRPAVDAVQEVEVQTGTYSAQYGAYMGVHLNVITKSGTNDLHGSLVEFLRNDALDARPYFLSQTAPVAPLRQNQFGFELDGPVLIPKLYDGRNKTFFMGSYEGLRQIRQSAGIATVMTPQMFQGNFSQTTTAVKDPFNGNTPFPGNIIPTSRLSAVSLKLQQYLPSPRAPGITSNLPYTAANNNNTDQTIDRIDQNIGQNVRLFFRYQRQTESILAGASIPVNGNTSPVLTNNYTVGYTHTLSPHLVNDLRIGRQYFNSSTLNPFYTSNAANAGAQLGIPGFDADVRFNNPGIPDFTISGFTGFNNASTNWFQDDKTWQGSEQLSWTKGSHNIMAGVELRKLITGRQSGNSPRGIFTFNSQFTGYAPADFMLGLPQTLITPLTQTRGVVAEWRDGFFVLDNWQVSRKLTVNYGIRYELPTVPYSANGYHTELNPQQTLLVPANPPQPGFQFIGPNHNDWVPRLGFAYRFTSKTVFRGGYGIYYNPNQTNSFTFLNGNPPFGSATTYTSLPTAPTLSLVNPTPAGSANAVALVNIVTDNWSLPTAYMHQWSFGVERELWRNGGLEVQYLGSHSLHLDRSYYNNTPQPGPGLVSSRRPNPLFGQIRTVQNDEIANYHGLSFVLRQRMTRGLTLVGSYTWSHTLDVGSDSNNSGAPMNPYNWRADYGNSNWDIRHRLVAFFVYDIPFLPAANLALRQIFAGWQMNGIVTAQTGLPFNVSTSVDTANTAAGGVYRPNLIAKPSEDCGDSHLTGCISTAAYSLPPAGIYTYGSEGRNLLHGPGLFNIDYSLFKSFAIKERLRLQFRAELFNIFNHPNFNNPASSFATASFGNITSTSTDNREIQFGLKLLF
jgi:Carboxypeptidase regulatory-like domain/TonB dependent receptor